MAYESGIRDADKPLQKDKPKEYFVPKHADVKEQKVEDPFNPFIKVPEGGSIPTTPVTDGDTVFFGACTKYFYAVDAKTGRQKWKFLTKN